MPGYGGWAAIVRNVKEQTKHIIKGATTEPDATNQRMELLAALEGLKSITKPSVILLITDCRNLYKAFVACGNGGIGNARKAMIFKTRTCG